MAASAHRAYFYAGPGVDSVHSTRRAIYSVVLDFRSCFDPGRTEQEVVAVINKRSSEIVCQRRTKRQAKANHSPKDRRSAAWFPQTFNLEFSQIAGAQAKESAIRTNNLLHFYCTDT